MTLIQQQNEIIGDLTVKLAMALKNKETLDSFTESMNEYYFDDAVFYLKASDHFGFTIFENRAKEIDGVFGFYKDDLKRKYKEMILNGDSEKMDEYITDLIPF